jgi:hypothetical protein
MASKNDGYQVSSIMKKLNTFHEQLHLHNLCIQLLLHEPYGVEKKSTVECGFRESLSHLITPTKAFFFP